MIKDGIPEIINERDSLKEDNRELEVKVSDLQSYIHSMKRIRNTIKYWRITSCVLLGLLMCLVAWIIKG